MFNELVFLKLICLQEKYTSPCCLGEPRQQGQKLMKFNVLAVRTVIVKHCIREGKEGSSTSLVDSLKHTLEDSFIHSTKSIQFRATFYREQSRREEKIVTTIRLAWLAWRWSIPGEEQCPSSPCKAKGWILSFSGFPYGVGGGLCPWTRGGRTSEAFLTVMFTVGFGFPICYWMTESLVGGGGPLESLF